MLDYSPTITRQSLTISRHSPTISVISNQLQPAFASRSSPLYFFPETV
jgi:hypothetical protein